MQSVIYIKMVCFFFYVWPFIFTNLKYFVWLAHLEIVHRDLKLENILIKDSIDDVENLDIKVSWI